MQRKDTQTKQNKIEIKISSNISKRFHLHPTLKLKSIFTILKPSKFTYSEFLRKKKKSKIQENSLIETFTRKKRIVGYTMEEINSIEKQQE